MPQTHDCEGKHGTDDAHVYSGEYSKDYAFADEADRDLDFVARLSDFLENTGFHDKMQTFLEDNCHVVDSTTDEHSHEYWDIFQAYQERIDEVLEGFIVAEGVQDRNELLRTIKAACAKFDFADEYIQDMLATSEFPGFMVLLRETWQEFAKTHNLIPDEERHVDENGEIVIKDTESKNDSCSNHK